MQKYNFASIVLVIILSSSLTAANSLNSTPQTIWLWNFTQSQGNTSVAGYEGALEWILDSSESANSDEVLQFVSDQTGTSNSAVNLSSDFYLMNWTSGGDNVFNVTAAQSFLIDAVMMCNWTHDVGSESWPLSFEEGSSQMIVYLGRNDTDSFDFYLRDADNQGSFVLNETEVNISGTGWFYLAISRNCTGITCDMQIFINETLTKADNDTIVDGGFLVGGDNSVIGCRNGCDVSGYPPTNCSMSEYRAQFNTFLTPDNVSTEYNWVFNLYDAPASPGGLLNLTDNITAYWRFEESTGEYVVTSGDTSVYNLEQDTGEPMQVKGIIEAGQRFNGTTATCSDCAKIKTLQTHSLYQDGTISNGFTFSFWAKIEYGQNRAQYLIDHQATVGTPKGYMEVLLLNDSKLRWNGDRDNNYVHDVELTGIVNITDGEWHHYVLTYSAPDFPTAAQDTIYIDNITVFTTSDSYPAFTEVEMKTYFGGRAETNTQGLNGIMDEIILYNRTLNASEVERLYNEGLGIDPIVNDTNLITLNFTDGFIEEGLTNYNVSYTINNNETLNISYYFLGENLTFHVRNTTANYNISGTILNASNYQLTNIYNSEITNDTTTNMYFYNETLLEINFVDQITGADIDNATVDIIGSLSYVEYTLNSTINTQIAYGTYDLTAESNISWYPDQSSSNDQNVSNLSTISGTFPFYNLTMTFLNSSQTGATNITATVYDQSLARLQNATIHIQLFDVGDNSYSTIQTVTTNFAGETRFQAILYDELYRFLIFYEGELTFTSNTEAIISTTLNFFIDTVTPVGTEYFTISDINFACAGNCLTYDNSTKTLTLDWINLVDPATQICLNVTRKSILQPPITTNSSCSSSESGQINIVVVEGTNFIYQADAFIALTQSPSQDYLVDSYDISYPGANPTGSLGLFLTVVFVFVGLGLGAFNPAVALWTVPLSILFTRGAQLHNIPYEVIVPMFLAGIMLSIWISRRA